MFEQSLLYLELWISENRSLLFIVFNTIAHKKAAQKIFTTFLHLIEQKS